MKVQILLLVTLCSAISCSHDEDAAPCSAPDGITIDGTCDAGTGVVLTVRNYGGVATGLEWEIYMSTSYISCCRQGLWVTYMLMKGTAM